MLSREQTLHLLGALATMSVTGVGLAIGGAIGATLMVGIGLNLSSSIIETGCLNLKERWLNSDYGLVNHDLKKTLSRAFVKALSSLERKYFETEMAKLLQGYEKDSIRDLFRELKENAENALLASLDHVHADTRIKRLLLNHTNPDSNEVWEQFAGDDLISKYNVHLRDFVRQYLVNEAVFWFGEELKTDNRECNKAWRAFQRMILEGIYEDVKAVRASQEEIGQDLHKLDRLRDQIDQLRDVFDRRLPDELFQRDLQLALDHVSRSLQMIAETNASIAENVVVIGTDVKTLLQRTNPTHSPLIDPNLRNKELAQIRTQLITAQSRFELSEAFYRVEEFLTLNPNFSEACLLKDQIIAALAVDRQFRVGVEEIGISAAIRTRRKLNLFFVPFVGMAVVFLVYLVLRWLGIV